MFRSRRVLLDRFRSHSQSPEANQSTGSKLKGEFKKQLKAQLILIPIVFCGVMYFNPPQSKEEFLKSKAEYEKNAGWKS